MDSGEDPGLHRLPASTTTPRSAPTKGGPALRPRGEPRRGLTALRHADELEVRAGGAALRGRQGRGIRCNPAARCLAHELEHLTRRYTTEIILMIGPDHRHPGARPRPPTSRPWAWMMDTYSMTPGAKSVPGVVTGKPLIVGRLGRPAVRPPAGGIVLRALPGGQEPRAGAAGARRSWCRASATWAETAGAPACGNDGMHHRGESATSRAGCGNSERPRTSRQLPGPTWPRPGA